MLTLALAVALVCSSDRLSRVSAAALHHQSSESPAHDLGGHARLQQEEGDGRLRLGSGSIASTCGCVCARAPQWSLRCVCVLCPNPQLSHGILLGVVGSDIPLMEVMKLAPRYMVSLGTCTHMRAHTHHQTFKIKAQFLSPCSLAPTAMPSSPTTMATSWHTLTSDLWCAMILIL